MGIGASAGGLAAFEAFFSAIPTDIDLGMAFVVVQHLAPDHKSILTDLVRNYTTMQVFEVEDGMEVRPGCVYIIPPGRDMAFLNGTLQLMDPEAPHGQRLPIDFFFRSLAQDQRDRAIGIVLSGTGSDGTLGVRAIKGEGGMVMAQSPESTEYDGMPRSAIATGLVDYELPPPEMPARLIAYAAKAIDIPYRLGAAPTPKPESVMKKIFILLRAQTGHDFSLYKPSTIHRRIERRMAVHQIETAADYLKFLGQAPTEVEALFRDLLIGVTSFFRDPEVFKALGEQVIPKIFSGKPAGSTVRIWSPGCSTGEEAYSLAILMQEHMESLKVGYKLQVFATDIDSQAIATARAGMYPASIATDILPERLSRFFVAEPDGSAYRIHKSLRDILVFSEQNMIKDPPFSKLDLISCRNLLIYMDGELQKKIIPLFHYALNPGGFLVLGTSETVGDFSDLYSTVDRKLKLYQRKESPHSEKSAALASFVPHQMPGNLAGHPRTYGKGVTPTAGNQSSRELTERALLAQFAPVGILVNGRGEILYLHGRTGLYLEPVTGEAGVYNIIKMAREGLGRALTTALHKVAKTKQIERCSGISVKTNGDFTSVDLTVSPIAIDHAAAANVPLYLVTLQPSSPPSSTEANGGKQTSAATAAAAAGADAHIAALQQELRAKEEYLQSTNEELETSNEELKSSNEEMQSVNEELQSTNEELETSKEELQSVNEELATVNVELQTKVTELSRANNDMNNLLAGTGIGTVFVDHELRIMRFTPAATRIINLISADVGRPVHHILSNLVGYSRLAADIKEVLSSLIPKEVEVQIEQGGAWYTMRILPYRTLENVIEGAVLTFVEITERKKAKQALQETQVILQAAVDQTQAGIAIAGASDGMLRYVNDAGIFIRGGTRENLVNGVGIDEYVSRWHLMDLDGNPMKADEVPLVRAIRFGETCRREFIIQRDNGEDRIVLATAAPIKDEGGKILEGIVVFMDITESKRSEQQIRELERERERESESRFRQLTELLPQLVWSCLPDGQCDYLSPQWLAFTGESEAQQLGFGWLEQAHPDDKSAWKSALATGEPFRAEFRIRHHSGIYHNFDIRATALRDSSGQIAKWSGLAIEITDQMSPGP